MAKDQIIQVFHAGTLKVSEDVTIDMQGVLLEDGRMFIQTVRDVNKKPYEVVWVPHRGPDTSVKLK